MSLFFLSLPVGQRGTKIRNREYNSPWQGRVGRVWPSEIARARVPRRVYIIFTARRYTALSKLRPRENRPKRRTRRGENAADNGPVTCRVARIAREIART